VAGLNIAKRKPTERFLYGYYKAELLHCSHRLAIPIVEDKGLDSLVSLHFGSAPYFAFMDVEEGQIVGSYVKANEGKNLFHKKGIQTANILIEENVTAVLAGSIGEGQFHILGDKLIQIYSLQIYENKRGG